MRAVRFAVTRITSQTLASTWSAAGFCRQKIGDFARPPHFAHRSRLASSGKPPWAPVASCACALARPLIVAGERADHAQINWDARRPKLVANAPRQRNGITQANHSATKWASGAPHAPLASSASSPTRVAGAPKPRYRLRTRARRGIRVRFVLVAPLRLRTGGCARLSRHARAAEKKSDCWRTLVGAQPECSSQSGGRTCGRRK